VGWQSRYPERGTLVSKPAWMTDEQFGAIVGVYLRDTSVTKTFQQFFRTAEPAVGMKVCMLPWKGMFLGIEEDGYTHS